MKWSTILSSICLFYLTASAGLMYYGKLTFGWGLGDVFAFLGIVILVIVQLSLVLFSVVKRKPDLSKTVAVTYAIIAILVTLMMTIGRGPEKKWNGRIFVGELKQEKRATTSTIKIGREMFAASSSRFAVFSFGRKDEGVKALFS
jgi:hypothetical protein